MDQDRVEVNNSQNLKMNKANIQSSWPNQLGQLYGFWGNFLCGTRRVVPSRQDSSILPAQVANHSAGFDSFRELTELAI